MDARTPTISEHALDPALAADEAVRRLARALLAEVALVLAAFPTDPERTTHEARKGLKATRALLRLADPRRKHLGEVDATLRRVAASLAGAREARVLAETIASLAGNAPEETRALFARLRELAEARAEAAETRTVNGRTVRRASRTLTQLADGAAAWPLPTSWKDLLRSERQTLQRARKHLAHGLAKGDAEVLHRARGWVVRHRYHLAFLSAAGRPTVKRRKRMQDLRDLLGRHHDLAEAREAIAAEGALAASELATVEAVIGREMRRVEKRVRRAHKRLFMHGTRPLKRALKAAFGASARPG